MAEKHEAAEQEEDRQTGKAHEKRCRREQIRVLAFSLFEKPVITQVPYRGHRLDQSTLR